jgi:hypothetical protein
MTDHDVFDNLVLFCEWCGDELVEGDCPFCGWHSPLWDDPLINPRRFAEKDTSEENENN